MAWRVEVQLEEADDNKVKYQILLWRKNAGDPKSMEVAAAGTQPFAMAGLNIVQTISALVKDLQRGGPK